MARAETAGKGNAGKRAPLTEAERQERLAQLVLRHTKFSASEAAELRVLFPAIIKTHRSTVWGMLRGRGLEREEAKDLSQEIFVALHLSIVDEGFPDSLTKWLRTTTHGKLLNHLRGKKREPVSVGLPSSGSEPPRTPRDLDAALDGATLRALVFPLLSSEHREVLEAVRADLSYEEAAGALDIPLGTFKRRLIEARRQVVLLAQQFLPPSKRAA